MARLSNLPPGVSNFDIEEQQGDPVKLRRYGSFMACCAACRDGFRTDRRYGLIYPPVRDLDTGKLIGWNEASIKYRFCAYCKASNDYDI